MFGAMEPGRGHWEKKETLTQPIRERVCPVSRKIVKGTMGKPKYRRREEEGIKEGKRTVMRIRIRRERRGPSIGSRGHRIDKKQWKLRK